MTLITVYRIMSDIGDTLWICVQSTGDIVQLKKAYARVRNKYLNLLQGSGDNLTASRDVNIEQLPCVDCGEWFLPDSGADVQCPRCHTGKHLADLEQPLLFSRESKLDNEAFTFPLENPTTISNSFPIREDQILHQHSLLYSNNQSNPSHLSPFVQKPASPSLFDSSTFRKFTERISEIGEVGRGIDFSRIPAAPSPIQIIPSISPRLTQPSHHPEFNLELLYLDKSQNTSPKHPPPPSEAWQETSTNVETQHIATSENIRLKDSESQTLFTASEQTQTDDEAIAEPKTKPLAQFNQELYPIKKQQIYLTSSENIKKENVNINELEQKYENLTTTPATSQTYPKSAVNKQIDESGQERKPVMATVEKHQAIRRSHSLDSKTVIPFKQGLQHWEHRAEKPSSAIPRDYSSSEDEELPSIEKLIPNFHTIKPAVFQDYRTPAISTTAVDTRIPSTDLQGNLQPNRMDLFPASSGRFQPVILQGHHQPSQSGIADISNNRNTKKPMVLQDKHRPANTANLSETNFQLAASTKPSTSHSTLTKMKKPNFKSLVSSFKKTMKLQDPSSLATLAQSPKYRQDLTFISQNMEQIRSKLTGTEQQFLAEVFRVILPPSPALPTTSPDPPPEHHRNLHQAMQLVLPWLNTAQLLRCRAVCRTWRDLLAQPHHWSMINLSGCLIRPQLFKLLAGLCTSAHTVNLQGLRLKNHQDNTRGRLESTLDLVLQSCGPHLRTFSVIDCEDLITDRCLWQLSRHNPDLEQLIYMSQHGGPSAEALWALGSGCHKIHTLLVPPLDTSAADQVDDHGAAMMVRCWPQLKELCVGGTGITLTGLLDLARGCPQLVTLELDHMGQLEMSAAQALCQSGGLLHLRCLYLTHTPVSPSVLRCLSSSLSQLQALVITLAPEDYENRLGYFKKKIRKLQQIQQKDPFLSRILHLNIQE